MKPVWTCLHTNGETNRFTDVSSILKIMCHQQFVMLKYENVICYCMNNVNNINVVIINTRYTHKYRYKVLQISAGLSHWRLTLSLN